MHPSHEPLPGAWSAPPSGHPQPAGHPEAHPDGYPVPLHGGHSEPPAAGPGWWSPQRWGIQQSRRRPWRRTLVVTAAVIAVISALGVPFGLLWAWLTPGVPVIDVGDNGVVVNDPSPEQYIAADGWFTLLGLGFGLLVAITTWLVLRRDRGPFLLLGVVIGASLAAHRVAPFVGEAVGRNAYDEWKATAAQGATYLAPPELHSFGPTLVPAFAAAIVLTLLAGWSNDPDLDQPGAQPGYGPNHPGYPPAYPGYDSHVYNPVDYQRPASPYDNDDGPAVIGGGDHIDPAPGPGGPADPHRPN